MNKNLLSDREKLVCWGMGEDRTSLQCMMQTSALHRTISLFWHWCVGFFCRNRPVSAVKTDHKPNSARAAVHDPVEHLPSFVALAMRPWSCIAWWQSHSPESCSCPWVCPCRILFIPFSPPWVHGFLYLLEEAVQPPVLIGRLNWLNISFS